ncbi:hypothetical protein [Niabella hibiscisoli]|uniref:hypothetical protein n=1 Tax=Niabella hibiscisoli TaxID=1825928 RepID=UPI001F10E409|nr:hypothetical protein [Niabella hibiscisoli]MCH5714730.1 hypothetical protein [Niabella hibiscisoli]
MIANTLPHVDSALQEIADKVYNGQRISDTDGLYLFEHASLAFVGALGNHVREQKHGDITYFNRNFHIEPTNACIYSCHFCSYSKLYAHRDEAWELSLQQMMDIVKNMIMIR